MTLHRPSRRVVLAGPSFGVQLIRRHPLPSSALAMIGALAAVIAIYWRAIALWLLAAACVRFVWRRYFAGPSRRGRRDWFVRLVEAGALASGARTAHRSLASRRVEERREELHAAKLATEQARAEELRSRTEHRIRTRAEQAKAEHAAYVRGAADAGRP